jgi:hypothetical protein
LVAVHAVLPLSHAAGVPPLFPPEIPVDKPVKHLVNLHASKVQRLVTGVQDRPLIAR